MTKEQKDTQFLIRALDTNTLVRNVVGSSKRSNASKNQMKRYREICGYTYIKTLPCSKHSCNVKGSPKTEKSPSKDISGAHIILVNDEHNWEYIIPLCQTHNKSLENMKIINTNAVFVNEQAAKEYQKENVSCLIL